MTRLASRPNSGWLSARPGGRRENGSGRRNSRQRKPPDAGRSRRLIVVGRPGSMESPLRFVVGIAGRVRLQPEFLTNVGILLGVERSPVLGEQA